MRFMKWIGLAAAVSLAVACFYPGFLLNQKILLLPVSGLKGRISANRDIFISL